MSASELAVSEPSNDGIAPSEGDRLSLEQRILNLKREGKTQLAIGQEVGISQPHVSRILSKFMDTRELARMRTRNAALKLAETTLAGLMKAAAKGKTQDALEMLDRLGVAEKRQAESGKSAVQINIGMAGQPVGRDPLEQVNVISNYQTQTISEGETSQ